MQERSSIMFSMKTLNTKTRGQIIKLLSEGMSLRAVARVTGVARNTVDKLLRDVGSACLDYQDEHLRNLPCERVQCDEIWSFVYAREKNVPHELQGVPGIGDIWTWTAIDADTKLVPCWHVGNRRVTDAKRFIGDLASRLANRVQLSTDGHRPYLNAIEATFAGEIDYGQIVKLYGDVKKDGESKRNPAGYGTECIGIRKSVVSANPDECCISTSIVERQNLTMRMSMRRFTRLTNAHSKKVENHMHAVSLHFMFYNFGRKHMSLDGRTPAMAAGVSDHVWSVEEIANLAKIEAPKARGPYKKKPA
jgi:IS1 family transposase